MATENRKVLVVDDSRAILEVMTLLLRELQIDSSAIDAVDNCGAALTLIAANPVAYQVAFVDLNMPGIDGMEFIRLLGQRGYCGGVVIFSEMDPRVVELAAELAIENKVRLIGAISKPLTLEKVELALNKLAFFNAKVRHKHVLLDSGALEDAIFGQQITPYYQPKVNGVSQKIHSLEVLARIRRPGQADSLTPDMFIEQAEENQWLNLITFQLLAKALQDYPEFKSKFGYDVKLSFNLSVYQLDDFGFPDKITAFLGSRQVDPVQIIFEITENNALRTPVQLENLNRLRMRGFGVSLDDYGVGFTNVKQLRTLPFTEIKIDRTLISGINCDTFSQAIVTSLVEVAKTFTIDLVAEGLESYQELNYLQAHFPSILLQGYLITRPKPKQALLQWFQSWHSVFSPES